MDAKTRVVRLLQDNREIVEEMHRTEQRNSWRPFSSPTKEFLARLLDAMRDVEREEIRRDVGHNA